MKMEIVQRLKDIAGDFEPSAEEPELTMFGLISRYNKKYKNTELIGGEWVRENIPELANLP